MVKVKDICQWMRELAPENMCEAWDNVGLLVGKEDTPVHRVLIALDFTEAVLQEAIENSAEMVITHHPIIFYGLKALRADLESSSLVFKAIQAGVTVYSAHTNLDAAHPGVNDALAVQLGLTHAYPCPSVPMACMGSLPNALDAAHFRVYVHKKLSSPWIRFCGKPPQSIQKVMVLGGAGGEYLEEASVSGADVYLTGEVKYHDALRASGFDLFVCEIGHFWSEYPIVLATKEHLQSLANAVKYKVEFLCSETVTCPYFS